jgi:hypothetical protein
MVRPKWFRAWLRVRSSSTEVCPSCRRPQFCTARSAYAFAIPRSHEHKMELKADGTVEPIAHRNTRKPKATSCKGCDSRISPGCIGLAHVLTAHSRPAYDAGPPVTLGHCGATSSGATVRRSRRTSAGSGRLHCSQVARPRGPPSVGQSPIDPGRDRTTTLMLEGAIAGAIADAIADAPPGVPHHTVKNTPPTMAHTPMRKMMECQ